MSATLRLAIWSERPLSIASRNTFDCETPLRFALAATRWASESGNRTAVVFTQRSLTFSGGTQFRFHEKRHARTVALYGFEAPSTGRAKSFPMRSTLRSPRRSECIDVLT